MYIYIYIYIHIYIYIYIYIHIYIYIYISLVSFMCISNLLSKANTWARRARALHQHSCAGFTIISTTYASDIHKRNKINNIVSAAWSAWSRRACSIHRAV